MFRAPAAHPDAVRTLRLVEALQARFVGALQALPACGGFTELEWFRDGGRHGGGTRFEAESGALLNRASINVSQVQYDDDPKRRLASATALSTIVHPCSPRAPSMHMHVSWTDVRGQGGRWRLMADLNPAIANDADRARFEAAIERVVGPLWAEGRAQGDRYFHIPALDRHRGVTHFYLEGFDSGSYNDDATLAKAFVEAVIDTYVETLEEASSREPQPGDLEAQLAYHTLYLFQVLTLDRGTTSGLLVHDQNDIGILGSLPAVIDAKRLASWRANMPAPQGELLDALCGVLGATSAATVDEVTKGRLASAVRAHYAAHPEALALQASGAVVPTTVANHGSNGS